MLSKGTIIYIGGFELPDKNAAAHRVISNAKALRDLGYKVIFCGVTKDSEKAIGKAENIFGFKCYFRQYPIGLKQWLNYFTSIKEYKNIILKYEDVKAVICYNMPSWPLYSLKLVCRKLSVKIISDCTEWYKGSLKGNFVIGMFKRIDSVLRMHYLQKHLDGVIAISEYLNNFYSSKNVNTIKIPPLVDFKDLKWLNPLVNNDILNIVYAGGAFSSKDSYVKDRLDLVIQALSYLKIQNYSFRFNVVGCELEDFRSFYPSLIKDIDILSDSVKFHGKLSHQAAIMLVKAADYSVFIRDESIVTKAGFPTKFVESITCGTPVLTNRNSNVYDYLEQSKNGFKIDSTSLDTIIESLKIPLGLPSEDILEMRKYTYATHRFDYRNFTKEFEELLIC